MPCSIPQAQTEELIVPDTDSGFTQTVTLVPSESANGEVSYVLVVADENNPEELVNLNIEMDTEGGEPVCSMFEAFPMIQ